MDTIQIQSNVIQLQSPIEVVEAFIAAGCAKDVERCSAMLHEDAVAQLVPFRPARGRKNVEKLLESFFRFPGSFHIQVHNIAERNGIVLTERTDSVRGSWLPLEFWVCGTFEVRDGKIVLWRDYFDPVAFAFKVIAAPFQGLFDTAQKRLVKPAARASA